MLLGIANVLVIAVGMTVLTNEDAVFMFVTLFGGVPGLAAGALLGVVGAKMTQAGRLARLAALGLPALGLVFLLARWFLLVEFALISCIPTLVAVLILEQWTRVVPVPPVPVARVAN